MLDQNSMISMAQTVLARGTNLVGECYKINSSSSSSMVQLKEFGGGSIKATVFKTSMQICTDGCGSDHGEGTPPHQDDTTMQDRRGQYPISFNADTIPYIVLPEYNRNHVDLGDVGVVVNERTGDWAFVIYGERGPEDKIGEASVKTSLDIGNRTFTSNGKPVGEDDAKFIYIMFNKSGVSTSYNNLVFKDGLALPNNTQIQAKALATLMAFIKENDYIA